MDRVADEEDAWFLFLIS